MEVKGANFHLFKLELDEKPITTVQKDTWAVLENQLFQGSGEEILVEFTIAM